MPVESCSKAVHLEPGETFIGRDSSNTIRLAHGSISRIHAKIIFEKGQYILVDLNSRNGVFVNRKKVKKAVLRSGDTIHFGNRRFQFNAESFEYDEGEDKRTITLTDTLQISDEEMDRDELLAREAEAAAQTFLRVPEERVDGEVDPSRMAHHRLSLLYKLSEQIRSAEDPDEILNQGLSRVFEALPSAERAAALLREDGIVGPLEVRTVRYKAGRSIGEKTPISRTVLNRVVLERVAVVSRNVLDDARFEESNSIRIHNLQSIICVPLINGDNVIGALHIDTSDILNPFSPNDMEFVAAVANEMALSIENDRLQKNAIRNERMAAIGMTVTNIAHNIKNLLHLNVNAIELMDRHLEGVDDEKIHTRWYLLRTGLERMNRLASDMLEFAKFEPSEQTLLNVNGALLENKEFLEKTLIQKGISLEWELAPDVPEYFLNEEQLQRALLNLIVNAEDALKEIDDGRITISTDSDAHKRLMIRVSDNGCGIPPKELNKVFNLFFTTKGAGGSGLGLPMVQKFVESAGGKVTVESTVNKGTTFNMIFPSLNKEDMDAARPSRPNLQLM
jgi:signal transduction histidine kinase